MPSAVSISELTDYYAWHASLICQSDFNVRQCDQSGSSGMRVWVAKKKPMTSVLQWQTAAELARKREKKAPHQRQGFEREQHNSRAPQQDSAQPVSDGDLVAPSKPAPLKQKQKQKKQDVEESSKAAAGTPMAVDNDAQQQAVSAKKEPKPLKKQKKTAKQEDAQTEQTEVADGEDVKNKKRKRPEQVLLSSASSKSWQVGAGPGISI